MRKQHDQIDLITPAKRFHGGPAGIARRRHHDGAALAAAAECVIHQPRQQLHGHVLERQRRPVKQFEHERVHVELRQRHDRRMAEITVSLARHAGEVRRTDGFVSEPADDVDRHFRIGAAGEAGNLPLIDPGPGLRHIKPAVAGKAREHGVGKAERRGLAPGGDVAHCRLPARLCRPRARRTNH